MSKSRFSPSTSLIFMALLGYLVWVVYPLIWVAYSSLKTDQAIFGDAFALPTPGHLAWSNYAQAWRTAHFGEYLLNSIVVTLSSVAAVVLLGARAAYALARFRHPFSGAVYWLFVAGLMIPTQLVVIPLFFELRSISLLDTKIGLIAVYTANGLPFTVFILTGFFRALPRSLYEAAVVDGCSEAQAFWRVMLPLAKPGLVTVAIFQFIGIWKEYFFVFMFTPGADTENVRTLPLGLANLSIAAQYHGDFGMLFAGLVMVTLPVLVVYVVLQKHVIKGVTAGALKG